MLFLLLITHVLANNLIILGVDDNYHQVTENYMCEYPTQCYNNMLTLIALSNVSYIMMIPLSQLSNCDLRTNSTDNIYLVFGLNDQQPDPNSYRLVDSLWNTLTVMCDIWNIPTITSILIASINF